MGKDGNILVLTGWSFKDALVQTYTLPYVSIIRELIPLKRKIFVVTAEQPHLALSKKETIQVNKEWEKRNMQLIPREFKRFGIKKLLDSSLDFSKLFILIKRHRIEKIHAFCTPAGGLAYLLSRCTGAELIIDSYEPHAEPMVESGTWQKKGIAYKLLFNLERMLSKKAAYIIATTRAMKDYAKQKYHVELKNFFVKPACIDFDHFFPREKDEALVEELSLKGKIVCVYAGKLGGTYLRDEVFDFVRSCYDRWGDGFRFLMLSEESNVEIERQIKRVQLPERIVTKQFVFHNEIPRFLSVGDFAINPQVPVPSKRYGSPIKNGEYWAMGLPIVISPAISDDSDIVEQNHIGVVINLQNKENMPAAVSQIDDLLRNNKKEVLREKIFAVAKKYRSFEIAHNIYPLIYSRNSA